VSLYQIGQANIRIWEILVAVFLLVVIMKSVIYKRSAFLNIEITIIILPFWICACLSGMNANNIGLWAKQILLLFAMLLLFFIVSQRWARSQILQNIRFIIYPGIIVAAWGLLEMLIAPDSLPGFNLDGSSMPRARALFVEPNEFSQFLALPFAFIFSVLVYRRKISLLERLCLIIGLLVIVLAQVLSFSRGGMVAFFSEIFVWFALDSGFSDEKRDHSLLLKILITIALFVLTMSLMFGSEVELILNVFSDRMYSLFSGNDVTSKIRFENIFLALSMTMDSYQNFVLGIGFGNLKLLLGEGVETTANIFVDIFSETGIVGMLAFLIIIISALVLPLRTLRYLVKNKDNEMLIVFFGAYMSFVGLIAGGLTYATHMLNFFWFSCGLLFALYQYRKFNYFIRE
jgi:hypothetical protein